MSYFGEFDGVTEPSKQHLIRFLQQSRNFLSDVIRNRLVGFGRVHDLDLFDAETRGQAEGLIYDRDRDFKRIIDAVDHLPRASEALSKHGLVGAPQKLRLLAMVRLENRVGFFRNEEIIKKILEDIDNILDATRDAPEFASNEYGPKASQYQSSFIYAEMKANIEEIQKMIGILLQNVQRLARRPVARKGKFANSRGYGGAAVDGQPAVVS
ncbi:hypothetical protein EKL30_14685 [Candidimonas sp. SYP-B2681]|uniref:hypothetical protein n=1 Tax=Candidimonas sp. SYP-B2681 TaxID=2497686 RepID=UPI000F875D8C|nr:hypothetical protein [Candidimonas sp. SYP-B2681]RTZ40940.1 hypothetical protein EKL30_14685 [Candidimonas sp. SYP-B2681]